MCAVGCSRENRVTNFLNKNHKYFVGFRFLCLEFRIHMRSRRTSINSKSQLTSAMKTANLFWYSRYDRKQNSESNKLKAKKKKQFHFRNRFHSLVDTIEFNRCGRFKFHWFSFHSLVVLALTIICIYDYVFIFMFFSSFILFTNEIHIVSMLTNCFYFSSFHFVAQATPCASHRSKDFQLNVPNFSMSKFHRRFFFFRMH